MMSFFGISKLPGADLQVGVHVQLQGCIFLAPSFRVRNHITLGEGGLGVQLDCKWPWPSSPGREGIWLEYPSIKITSIHQIKIQLGIVISHNIHYTIINSVGELNERIASADECSTGKSSKCKCQGLARQCFKN